MIVCFVDFVIMIVIICRGSVYGAFLCFFVVVFFSCCFLVKRSAFCNGNSIIQKKAAGGRHQHTHTW